MLEIDTERVQDGERPRRVPEDGEGRELSP
jgi:hypothetical protein